MKQSEAEAMQAPLASSAKISPFSFRCARLSLGLIALFAAASLPARTQSLAGGPAPPAVSQITAPLDENRLTTLTGNTHPLAQASFDAGPVPASMPQNHILMMLRRSPQRDQALRQFMSEQYDPRSPNFHGWLTPGQFGELYGPSPEDINQVTGWLKQHGFVINQVSAGSTFIDFSGTAGQVETAFHTDIHYYRVGGETHFANASDPMIPAALAPVISGFRALHNFHPHSQLRNLGVVRRDPATKKWTRVAPGNLTGGSGANALYLVGPSDFAQIYGVNQVWQQSLSTPGGPETLVGTGQTIGVAGDTGLASSDIATFRDEFGITALGPNGSVFVDNPPVSVCPAPSGASDPEGYLDAEWSGAMAPDATIDFVACGDQGVTSGADLASAYIVDDPAHAQKIGVLSTSYGYCEANPISESDQFYVALWQQAAAEGMTVVVAAGDAGGAECDEFTGLPYAVGGEAVDAEASTPYNVAAGGTDFSDVFSGTVGAYWSASNGPNLESALSYIPETVWNDSCGNPLVLSTFGGGLGSSAGAGGFCTPASQQPIDAETGYSPYFLLFAGSGGLSTVSARPSWQAGVAGIPAGNARAVPDISMFGSSGYAWGQTLILCDSALLPSGTTCDFSNPNNLYASSGGGTSFVAPAFAGIMALINQKSGRQGQANNVLYPLAGQQYIASGGATGPNLATCAAYLGTTGLPSCYFHDISSTPNPNPLTQQQTPFLTGTTAMPCTGTATAAGTFTDTSTDAASNSENCYGYEITVTQNESSLTTTPVFYGILSTADNAASPAFPATPGYDLATGLGSPNTAALVNAPEWSGLSIANSALAQATVGAAYSQTLTASGRVPPYTWSVASGSLPSGLSLASATGIISGIPTAPGLSNLSIQVADSESTPATATASFSMTVVAAGLSSSTTALTSSLATVATGVSVTFTATVSGSGGVPSGTVTFYNGTSAIGTSTLASGIAGLTTSFSSAGTASIHAVYNGDMNFTGSTSATLAETIVALGLAANVNPNPLTIPRGSSGTLTLTLTPQGGLTGPVSFSCGTLPAHLSCNFAPPSITLPSSGGPATDVLTVNTAATSTALLMPPGGANGVLAAIMLWLPISLLGLSRRKWRKIPIARMLAMLTLLWIGFAGIAAMVGCGKGSSDATPAGTYSIPISLTFAGGTSQTVNATVTVQ
jgi:hypothetical protein